MLTDDYNKDYPSTMRISTPRDNHNRTYPSSHAPSFLCFLLLLASSAAAQLAVTQHILRTAEHVPSNARSAGTAGAGVAIPEGIACVPLNPSMLHSYNLQNKTKTSFSILSYIFHSNRRPDWAKDGYTFPRR